MIGKMESRSDKTAAIFLCTVVNTGEQIQRKVLESHGQKIRDYRKDGTVCFLIEQLEATVTEL